MIGIEGGIDIIFIISPKGFIQRSDCRAVFCRGGTIQHLGDNAVLVRKGKIKDAVNAALIVGCIIRHIKPCFGHQIGVPFLRFDCISQPFQEVNIRLRCPGIILLHRIQTETAHAHIQPVFRDLRNLLPQSFAV